MLLRHVVLCVNNCVHVKSSYFLLLSFIGTSACAEHFQAYLLEGLVRWNEDRAEAGCSLVKDHTRPAKYTGMYF